MSTYFIIHSAYQKNALFSFTFGFCYSSVLWTKYGLLKADSALVFVNSAGALLSINYVIVYYIFTSSRVWITIICANSLCDFLYFHCRTLSHLHLIENKHIREGRYYSKFVMWKPSKQCHCLCLLHFQIYVSCLYLLKQPEGFCGLLTLLQNWTCRTYALSRLIYNDINLWFDRQLNYVLVYLLLFC